MTVLLIHVSNTPHVITEHLNLTLSIVYENTLNVDIIACFFMISVPFCADSPIMAATVLWYLLLDVTHCLAQKNE